jgi:two-component system, OmpR family, alkaline phosphatase synthesis response regulator PhoP
MSEKVKILLVDDEQDILEFIKYNLEKEGYDIFVATNGLDALAIAEKVYPALIILDVMMPDMDGVETCVKIRGNKKLSDTMVTFLTARNEDYTQIAGFDAGADDYITKPIKPRVLISRVKALLRRSALKSDTQPEKQDLGGLVIDRDKYAIFKEGVEISLPKKEFELLALLASKPGNVFPREVILDSIWGGDVIVGDRTIDVHVRKLREKIGDDYIKTIKGVGYKFDFR